MMVEKRFLIEFSFQDGNNVARYVAGHNLTIESVTRWAEKLIEKENEWVKINRIEGIC
jgi:hypothetical protein